MGLFILMLFLSLFGVSFLWISPLIKKQKRAGPKIPHLSKKSFLNKNDSSLERQLLILKIEKHNFRLWDYGMMIGFTVLEFYLSDNLLASLLYAIVGRQIIRIMLTLKAAKVLSIQEAQIQQFVRGIADFLETGENMIGAITNAAQQLKNPLRDYLLTAINSTKGNRSLPDAIQGLTSQLQNPIFDVLSRLIGKGLEDGQAEIAFAFRQLDWRMKEGERIILQRAAIISNYLFWIAILLLSGSLAMFIEKTLYNTVWQEVIQRPWVSIAGSAVDIILAFGLMKYTRLYTERGEIA